MTIFQNEKPEKSVLEENIMMEEDDEYFINFDESIYLTKANIDEEEEKENKMLLDFYIKPQEVKTLKDIALQKLIKMYWQK